MFSDNNIVRYVGLTQCLSHPENNYFSRSQITFGSCKYRREWVVNVLQLIRHSTDQMFELKKHCTQTASKGIGLYCLRFSLFVKNIIKLNYKLIQLQSNSLLPLIN